MYDILCTLNVCATQEHNRMIMEQKREIDELKDTIASIMARLDYAGI